MKNTFIKVYIYHFSINICIETKSQNYVLETTSLVQNDLLYEYRGNIPVFPFTIMEYVSKQVGHLKRNWSYVHITPKPSENLRTAHSTSPLPAQESHAQASVLKKGARSELATTHSQSFGKWSCSVAQWPQLREAEATESNRTTPRSTS